MPLGLLTLPGVGVTVGYAVAVGLGLGVGFGVGVILGLGVGFGVAVGRGVGVCGGGVENPQANNAIKAVDDNRKFAGVIFMDLREDEHNG